MSTTVTPIANLAGSSQEAGGKQPQHVMLVDTSGNPITAFGGSGGTAQNDQSSFTPGAGPLTPMGGLYETTPSALSNNTIAAPGLTVKRAQKVTIFDSSGVEITSFGGGIQYTEGDTDSTITGTAAMGEGIGNTLYPLQMDGSLNLKVAIQGTVTTTGPLTDAQLRATAVPISGALTDAQIRATALPVSGPVTDAQLRATAVPVSGPLTDTQLRNTAVPVSGSFYQATQPISAASLPLPTGAAAEAGGNLAATAAALGATSGAAVITDVNATIQQYLRGLVKLAITAGGFLVTATLAAGTAFIGYVGHGKTIKTASGSFTADTDVIAAVTSKRIKVIAISLFTFGTSATTVIWKSNGTGGTELGRDCLQSVASQVMGVKAAIACPSFLFATAAGEKLTADTNTGDTVHYTITYFDDDAT